MTLRDRFRKQRGTFGSRRGYGRIPLLEPPYSDALQKTFDLLMRGAEPLVLFRALAVSERPWVKFRAASLLDPPAAQREEEIMCPPAW